MAKPKDKGFAADYINVDLEIRSRTNLRPLADALSRRLFWLYVGRADGEFLATFDTALASVNVEYASKRASRRLAPPRLHLMARGWSERLCRAEFADGRREHQHKWKAVALEWDEASRLEVARTEELVEEVSGHA